MADNSGKAQLDLRLRRLTVVAPGALAGKFIQTGVIDQGINLHANGTPSPVTGQPTPHCAENGDGSFNWLLRIDKTAGTLTTGGADLAKDPFGTGYCFVNGLLGGVQVTPVTVPMQLTGNTFSTGPIAALEIPIFAHSDPNNVVILPINQLVLKNVTISPDGNCVGAYNPIAVDSQCTDVRGDCQKWKTSGALGGYITLEQADTVAVQDLSATLCVLLTTATGDTPDSGNIHHCHRDATGKIAATGDYCSTTNAPGGCGDSYWLAATFAAAAVKIADGSTLGDPLCGGGIQDAGGGG
jgi:hypothetical protein